MGNLLRHRRPRIVAPTLRLRGAVPALTYTGGMLSAPSSSFGTVRVSVLKVFAAIGVATLAAASTAHVASAAVSTPAPGAAIEPASGSTVGVAMPLTVTFDNPVSDRDAAQRSLKISSPDTPTGTFTWLSDDVMQWKPDQLWRLIRRSRSRRRCEDQLRDRVPGARCRRHQRPHVHGQHRWCGGPHHACIDGQA